MDEYFVWFQIYDCQQNHRAAKEFLAFMEKEP